MAYRAEVDGLNAGYAALVLEQYLDNPSSVSAEWRALFETSEPEELLAMQPGLARLLERTEASGNGHEPVTVAAASPPRWRS
jgi:2-oxoglutarate dehydrogenase complex dehydrogenase (E1) component-like enzyme